MADKESHLELQRSEDDVYIELKMRKSRAKAVYTRSRNKLKDILLEDEIDRTVAKDFLQKVEENMDRAINSIHELAGCLSDLKKSKEIEELLKEIDIIERQYEETSEFFHKQLLKGLDLTDKNHSTDETGHFEKDQLGKDLWKQLQRVSIPTFYGDKTKYPAWKAAFYSCVDQAPSSPEFKLLQLRQYLGGEALRSIENLGHSALAYEAAKDRLERKYGGSKRVINRFLDELEEFPPLKSENIKELDKFADLLDIAVINLQEANHAEDLKDGALYHRLLKKLPQSMLTRYNRQLYEQGKEESVETLRIFVNLETEYAIRASETIHGLNEITLKSKGKSFYIKAEQDNNNIKSKGSSPCKVCEGLHKIWNCTQFKSLNVEDRWRKAKEAGLCFRCLKGNHLGRECRFKGRCGINNCEKSHNRLLHKNPIALNINASEYHPSRVTANEHEHESQVYSANESKYVALRTVPVIICVKNKEVKINALLDDGSTRSYINEDVVAELGLTESSKMYPVEVNVLNGKTETFNAMTVNFTLKSVSKDLTLSMEAQTTRNVTGKLQPIDWNVYSNQWPHLKDINFPKISKKSKVDMLIGLDYVELHKSLGEIQSEKGAPVARLTPLGWTCVGPIAGCRNDKEKSSMFTFHANTILSDIDQTLQKFWEIEGIPDKDTKQISKHNKEIYEQTEKSITHNGERYEVPLPFKNTKENLPNNYEMAKNRLKSTERRLDRDPEVKRVYIETIKSYIEKGYIEQVDIHDRKEKRWLLPHFPVVRMKKETTKVRIVFDASARCEGICLNDVVEQGPTLQNNLFNILLRFRRNKVAVCCDIQEMYLRVGILPSDRRFHCFLFRESPDEIPVVFQFNRLVFGVNASPFLAQFVSQYNARKHASELPLAAETVLKSTNMDDGMDSVCNEETAILLYEQLTELWQRAGMMARKWISNSKHLLEKIPVEKRAMNIDITKEELPKLKTLGVMWSAESDDFTFETNCCDINYTMTKREYLKRISTLFDPLGFLAPFTIRAKILMQDLWISGIEWDEQISDTLLKNINQWFDELLKVDIVKVPRCLKSDDNVKQVTLHTFCDASTSAYGSVTYVRYEYENGNVSVKFVAAKSKVAPIASISIPRLELTAAVQGMKLAVAVSHALEIELKHCVFWTDSLDVVYWVRNQSRVFKPFVANRVSEIQQNTSPTQWRYVPGEENPADLVSRGTKLDKLRKDGLWLNGPEFLDKAEREWPVTLIETKEINKNEMKKYIRHTQQNMNFTVIENENKNEISRLEAERFSSWKKLKRVHAWVTRFIDNCRKTDEIKNYGELSCCELKDSEEILIRDTQIRYLSTEYNNIIQGKSLPKGSKLLPLNPVVDSDGLLRSNSRLKYAEFMSFDSRHPIILPRKSWITKLIVKEAHENNGHSGTNHTLSDLSTKYWIIHAREVIREVENTCTECKRRKAHPAKQIMAPLPTIRVNIPLKAFAHVAVDYGGPFMTIQGRGKSRQKRYMCLFTCLATRAVHIEMAYGLDTNAFLNAFYRMVSRRGLPMKVLSDNGTNFVGADKELKSLVKSIDNDKVTRSVANKGIDWQFNPPAAPHWGGVHEIMIKSAKRAMYAVLHGADITDEELLTAFVGAESLINSRPLTYQSANPTDCVPLTPNHFLFGQVGGEFAAESVENTSYTLQKRWRRIQELMRHFWQRWLKEWLPNLTPRKKWFQQRRDLQPDDVVLVISPDMPRGKWPLGRIIKVYPGLDGHIRSATVLVSGKHIDRPITKLCPLEYDI